MSENENKNKIVIIDFMATWCEPCKMQEPILEKLKEKFGDKVEFKKIDVDEDNELANKYNIHAVTTLVIEKDGKIFARYTGVTNLKILEGKINEVLK